MGLPMAKCLLGKGFAVHGFDLSSATRDELTSAGGVAVASLAEVAACAAVVILMLPDSDVVEHVLLAGEDPLIEHLADTIVVDMSSSAPLRTRCMAEKLAERGALLLDAPVSGGVRGAIYGQLAIMVGGDSAAVERVRPVLEAMGTSVFETGPLGSGHAMKALNNYVSAAGLTAACEAITIGRRFGLDPDQMTDILNASTGRNYTTEQKMRRLILSETYAGNFSLGLMAKDIATAAELSDELGLPGVLSRDVAALWRRSLAALGPQADHTEMARYIENAK